MKIIILAGGLGSRLWPMTTPPKQFSYFLGKETLYQKTLRRFLKHYAPRDFVIVTREEFFPFAQEQATAVEIGLKDKVIVETKAKNTAPAVLFALKWLKDQDALDPEFLVSPSDHLMAPESAFFEQLQLNQCDVLGKSHLLFGVFPTFPNTGYGYIQCQPDESISFVEKFIEKPSKELAHALIDKGNCLWNSGIFLFQTEKFLQDFERYRPKMYQAFQKNDFEALPSISIDCAFLEVFQGLKVTPLHLSWSDVGSWDSIYEVFAKDSQHNVKIGNVREANTKNSLIISNSRPITTIDIENLIIIDTDKGLLVAQRGSSQKVKEFVKNSDVIFSS